MTARYRVTPRARADLVAIARYTRDVWGMAKRDAYLRRLTARFDWLSRNPELGRPRPELMENVRSFPEGAHLIVYRQTGEIIEILGVPHKSMDIDSRFSDRN